LAHQELVEQLQHFKTFYVQSNTVAVSNSLSPGLVVNSAIELLLGHSDTTVWTCPARPALKLPWSLYP